MTREEYEQGLELYHHGIKGQKWGVRRFQNKDGSLTKEGKEHVKENEKNKEIKKTVKKAIAITAVAVAAYANRDVVKNFMNSVKEKGLEEVSKKTLNKGKQYVDKLLSDTKKSIKEGISQGTKEAPKSLAKIVTKGMLMNLGKEALTEILGEKEVEKIFKANNPKKIDSFWK